MNKQTGILLPVSSLPSRTGAGDLGDAAFQWMDLLADAGVTIWQILPVNPTGYGNSPYQPYSSYAGDELYISLDKLYEDGLLKQKAPDFHAGDTKLRYDEVRAFKETYLREAFANFELGEEYQDFCKQDWVLPYCVFRAFKKANAGKSWVEWPREQKEWTLERDAASDAALEPYQNEIRFQQFLQYIFYRQWIAVKEYAAKRQISIMGDVPFYVGLDSQDVWGGKENFLLGGDGRPTFIAGVPPDYFSETGQRWGNPIYDWEYLKETGYQFWTDRIGYNSKLFDIIRIDHFRAFDTYWKIPASCPTAVEGEWIEAPGYEVMDILLEKIPGVSLVAEDLGELRPEVLTLKEHYHLKGMKVQQFAFDLGGKYARDTFRDTENMIVYSGTHDNATLFEWYRSLTKPKQRKLRRWLKKRGYCQGSVVDRLICCVLDSPAEYAILPAADLLTLGAEGRINTPGTIGSPNWEWKLSSLDEISRCLKSSRRRFGAPLGCRK